MLGHQEYRLNGTSYQQGALSMWDIVKAITPSCSLAISGDRFSPVAKVLYVTQSAPLKKYAKIFDARHHVLVISPGDDLAYFGRDAGNLGDDLPTQHRFDFEGQAYERVMEDYQIVVEFEFGDPAATEGEVRFWDYESTSHRGCLISLGLVVKTQSRSDIVARIVTRSDIVVSENT
jgi:hypothetical protein